MATKSSEQDRQEPNKEVAKGVKVLSLLELVIVCFPTVAKKELVSQAIENLETDILNKNGKRKGVLKRL